MFFFFGLIKEVSLKLKKKFKNEKYDNWQLNN